MRIGTLSTVVFAVLALAAPVSAANQPHPTLNQIASEIAGKPVSVWCESSVTEWDSVVVNYMGGGAIGATVYGFTYPAYPTVFLSPQRCHPLQVALVSGVKDAGIAYLVAGLHTLAHEAVHQRGILDEVQAECAAVPLIPSLAERYFGITQTTTITDIQTVTRKMRRKIAGKWRTITYRTNVVVQATITNPDYQRVSAWATYWHQSLAGNYQGAC